MPLSKRTETDDLHQDQSPDYKEKKSTKTGRLGYSVQCKGTAKSTGNNGWSKIKYKDEYGNPHAGYVSSKYLSSTYTYNFNFVERSNNWTQVQHSYVQKSPGYFHTISELNVRSFPSRNGKVLGYFASNQQIHVSKIIGKWGDVFVEIEGINHVGYIHIDYIR